ncbi:MAG: hypothetical protein WDA24_11590 [Tissierellales bacterium]
MKGSWKELASVYIGTVVGAGFASGQEIIQFFGVFGYKGIYGIILATVLFSTIGPIVLSQVFKNKTTSYSEYIRPLFGRRISKIMELIIISYLFIGFCIMIAGSGAVFKEQFKLSANIGIYLMSLSCFLTLVFSVKGISFVNKIVVPFLIIGIILVGSVLIVKEGLVFSNFYGAKLTKTGNWVTSALLYVSFNSISSIVILTSLLPIINDRNQAIKGGVLGGLGLGAMAIFILLSTLILYNDVYTIEIPMIKAAQLLGVGGGYIYSIILWLSMFTTAIASGFGCINKFSTLVKGKNLFISAIFCIIAIPLAKLGFASLVSAIYPLFGYLGFFMFVYIMVIQFIETVGVYRGKLYRQK